MTGTPALQPAEVVLVYGLDTCEDTTRAREHLDVAGVTFSYIRLDREPAARSLVHDAGYFATPVVVTPAGRVYVEPTDAELADIVESVDPRG